MTLGKLLDKLLDALAPAEIIEHHGTRFVLAKKRIVVAALIASISITLAVCGHPILCSVTAVSLVYYVSKRRYPKTCYAITNLRVIEVTLRGAKTLANRNEIANIENASYGTKIVTFANGLAPIRINKDPVSCDPTSGGAMMRINEKEPVERMNLTIDTNKD